MQYKKGEIIVSFKSKIDIDAFAKERGVKVKDRGYDFALIGVREGSEDAWIRVLCKRDDVQWAARVQLYENPIRKPPRARRSPRD